MEQLHAGIGRRRRLMLYGGNEEGVRPPRRRAPYFAGIRRRTSPSLRDADRGRWRRRRSAGKGRARATVDESLPAGRLNWGALQN